MMNNFHFIYSQPIVVSSRILRERMKPGFAKKSSILKDKEGPLFIGLSSSIQSRLIFMWFAITKISILSHQLMSKATKIPSHSATALPSSVACHTPKLYHTKQNILSFSVLERMSLRLQTMLVFLQQYLPKSTQKGLTLCEVQIVCGGSLVCFRGRLLLVETTLSAARRVANCCIFNAGKS